MEPSIMFHHFHGNVHPAGQGSLSAEGFHDFIQLHKEQIVSADEWHERYKKNKLEDKVCITFDDNLKCQFDIALPVLESLNLKAFWFVYTSPLLGIVEKVELYRYFRTVQYSTVDEFYQAFETAIEGFDFAGQAHSEIKKADFENHLAEWSFYTYGDRKFRYIRDNILGVEKYNLVMEKLIADSGMDIKSIAASLWMSSNDIKTVHGKGHFIGLHSHSHPTRLDRLPDEGIEKEYTTNYNLLSDIIGKDSIFSMSHPCNAYNEHTMDVLNGLGIQIGFRSNNQLTTYTPLQLPRIDHTLKSKQ